MSAAFNKPVYDSPEWRAERDANYARWFYGDEGAIAFLHTVSHVIETWDDLIDSGDVEHYRIHGAFVAALVFLPTNPFFSQHSGYLVPVMMTAINAWIDSCNIERSAQNEDDSIRAFALKDIGIELWTQVAFLVGGYDHMRAVSEEIREFLMQDKFSTWEHRHVQAPA